MLSILLVDPDTCKQKACSCSCCFEVDGNFLYSLKFISACFQCSFTHCTVGSVTSGMDLVLRCCSLKEQNCIFLPFFVSAIVPPPGWEKTFCQHTPPLCFQAHATSFATPWPRSMSSLAIFKVYCISLKVG